MNMPTKLPNGPIVVGTDFSQESRSVVEYATALARAEAKPLYLAYAMPVLPDNSPEILEIQKEELSNQVKTATEALSKTGLPVEGLFTAGSAIHELIQAADKLNAGYIVVGTEGFAGFDRFLVGSVAEALVRKSNHPVIVVGREAARHSAQTVPWKRLVLACDTARGVTEAVQLAGNIAATHNASLTIFNARADGVESPTEEQFRVLEGMMSHQAWLTVKPQCLTRPGEPAQEIIRLVEELEADLLVMSAQSGGSWLTHLQAGIIATVLRSSRCPVMILRQMHKVHEKQQ